MNFTNDQIEQYYKIITEKMNSDPEFREKLKKDPKGTVEELIGVSLPDDFELKYIEADGKYGLAYVLPEFADDELSMEDLKSVAGGKRQSGSICPNDSIKAVSVAAIVSVCAAAVGVGPCPADVCGAQGVCGGDVCGAAVCGADGVCGGEVCGAEVCGAFGVCGGDGCGAAVCGLEGVCIGAACVAEACGIFGECTEDTGVLSVCAVDGGCVMYAAELDQCAVYGFEVNPDCPGDSPECSGRMEPYHEMIEIHGNDPMQDIQEIIDACHSYSEQKTCDYYSFNPEVASEVASAALEELMDGDDICLAYVNVNEGMCLGDECNSLTYSDHELCGSETCGGDICGALACGADGVTFDNCLSDSMLIKRPDDDVTTVDSSSDSTPESVE